MLGHKPAGVVEIFVARRGPAVDELDLLARFKDERACFVRICEWWRQRCGRIKIETVRDPKKAAGYVAKYISKGGEAPAWVRDLDGERLKVVSCSQGYWGRSRSRPETVPGKPTKSRRVDRMLGVRLDE